MKRDRTDPLAELIGLTVDAVCGLFLLCFSFLCFLSLLIYLFPFLYRRFPVKTLMEDADLFRQDILKSVLYSPDAFCDLLWLSHVDLCQVRRLYVWNQDIWHTCIGLLPHGLILVS